MKWILLEVTDREISNCISKKSTFSLSVYGHYKLDQKKGQENKGRHLTGTCNDEMSCRVVKYVPIKQSKSAAAKDSYVIRSYYLNLFNYYVRY